MASKRQACILLLLSLFTLSSIISSSHANGKVAIYWGRTNGDGTLTATCDSGNYHIVLLAFLNKFGCGGTPGWDFDGHCGSWDPCTKLQKEIVHCQEQGVEVFLSLGGEVGPYSLCSADDAKSVANYLYNNFLSGQFGPLGRVALDGIDFNIQSGSKLYWDDLAKELDALRKQNSYFYLSAAPQCVIPDPFLDKAIRTGLFDNIFVQFYNNPSCQYSDGNTALLFASWNEWTSSVARPNNSVFIGLPAAPKAAPSGGYIPPAVMISEVLPYINQTPNYGGVMLWHRYHDVLNHYSDKLKNKTVALLQTVTAVSDAISECVSAALHRILPKPKPL